MLGEKLFAVGGYDGSGYLSLVEAYDSRYVVHKILQIGKNDVENILTVGRIAGRRLPPSTQDEAGRVWSLFRSSSQVHFQTLYDY